jgi:sugar phosphate permease
MSKHASTAAAVQGSNAGTQSHSDKGSRYFQLMLLVLAAGAIYPILYLRQVYQTTMLEVFQINHSELGYLYSMLGTIFLLSYLPSGWLADRIAPRFLIFFSLVATGALGLWYSTAPSMTGLMIIFGCWGLGAQAGEDDCPSLRAGSLLRHPRWRSRSGRSLARHHRPGPVRLRH